MIHVIFDISVIAVYVNLRSPGFSPYKPSSIHLCVFESPYITMTMHAIYIGISKPSSQENELLKSSLLKSMLHIGTIILGIFCDWH